MHRIQIKYKIILLKQLKLAWPPDKFPKPLEEPSDHPDKQTTLASFFFSARMPLF